MLRSILLLKKALLTLLLCGSATAQDDDALTSGVPMAPLQAVANPASQAEVELGRELFFDVRLSRTDRVSCANCHDPEKGFSNGQRLAKGVDGREGKRHVPSLINVGYIRTLFWEGRAADLQQQALLPIQNKAEMDMPLEVLEKKLNGIADYKRRFEQVYGGSVTADRVAAALAAYQRSIVSNDTPFDHYLRGDRESLSASSKRGMKLFFGQASCSRCHTGAQLTDNKFHNIGAGDPADTGRRAVTRRREDHGAFRTPQLREVAHTAPYMHDGSFQTLKEVVQHYNFGGVTDHENNHRDELLEVLYLGEDQVDDLISFLTEGLSSNGNDLSRGKPQTPARASKR